MIGVLDSVEAFIVSPLEKLFRLEIEFHRRLRTVAPGIIDASSQHTSYALQTGYEQLIRATGTVTPHDVETLRERFILEGEGIQTPTNSSVRAIDQRIRCSSLEAV